MAAVAPRRKVEIGVELQVTFDGDSGNLTRVLDTLTETGGDLKAHLLYRSDGRQVGRFVCSEPMEAALELRTAGAEVESVTVVTVAMENRPGAVGHLIRSLEAENVQVSYSYSSSVSGGLFVILRTDDIPGAEAVLRDFLILPEPESLDAPMRQRRARRSTEPRVRKPTATCGPKSIAIPGADKRRDHRSSWVEEALGGLSFDEYTPLCLFMRQEGSDKSTEHNYTAVYHALFARFCDASVRLFEMGIGSNNTSVPSNMGSNGVPGASLRAWARYFPRGQIYGGDIDRDILFTDEKARIRTYHCDQTRPGDVQTALAAAGGQLDIVIDDGLHTWAANLAFLEAALPFVRPHGVLIIEDLHPETGAAVLGHMESLMRRHRLSYGCVLELPYRDKSSDNRLAIFEKGAAS